MNSPLLDTQLTPVQATWLLDNLPPRPELSDGKTNWPHWFARRIQVRDVLQTIADNADIIAA